MSVLVRFECDGCLDGKTEGLKWLSWNDQIQDIAPEGWIAFDPFTGCCYCPSCWEDIMSG